MDSGQYRDFESESSPDFGYDAGGGVKAEAASLGQQALAEGQARLADQVERLGRALKHGGESLHRQQELSLADYAQRLGGGCDRLAGYLRENSPRQLLDEVGDQVRRHPEVVLGGLFVAGVSLARFLRAAPSGMKGESQVGIHTGRAQQHAMPQNPGDAPTRSAPIVGTSVGTSAGTSAGTSFGASTGTSMGTGTGAREQASIGVSGGTSGETRVETRVGRQAETGAAGTMRRPAGGIVVPADKSDKAAAEEAEADDKATIYRASGL